MVSCDFASRHITISEKILPLCGFQVIRSLSTKRCRLQKQTKQVIHKMEAGMFEWFVYKTKKNSLNSQNFLLADHLNRCSILNMPILMLDSDQSACADCAHTQNPERFRSFKGPFTPNINIKITIKTSF